MPRVKKTTPTKEKKTATKGLSMPIYDLTGKSEKEMELPKEIFSVEANPQILAQYIRVYLANQRQGNASTKTRSEVTGSTRKIYKQKGTGRARHGARKAPIFVGGGVTQGPKPKDFSLKIGKKQKRIALFNSLTLKAKENSIVGLTNEVLNIEPKTKKIAGLFKTIGLNDQKVLLVLPNMKNNLWMASRNIDSLKGIISADINPYFVLKYRKIIFTEDALKNLISHFTKTK